MRMLARRGTRTASVELGQLEPMLQELRRVIRTSRK